MKTALITAIGSSAAPAVMAGLRARGYRVIACDIYPREWNAAAWDADDFFQAVLATDASAYVAQLLDAVKRYDLQMIVPLTDVEVDALCTEKARFAALGCTVCVPEEAVARLCRNKQLMAQRLHDVCRTIPTRSPYGWEPDAADYPLMLKPQSGRSSQGQAIVYTAEAYRSALASRDDLIAQPYLAGAIHTVDVARDRCGHVRTLVRKEHLRTVNGLGTTVETFPEHPLNAITARIAEAVGIVGVVNMEFIENGGEYWFLEVNPRFSGGLAFSVYAGADFVWMQETCHLGGCLENIPFSPKQQVMTRRIEIVSKN